VDQASDFDRLMQELRPWNSNGGDPANEAAGDSGAHLDGNGLAANTRAFISAFNLSGHLAAKTRRGDGPD
jgi:hypothetical protein